MQVMSCGNNGRCTCNMSLLEVVITHIENDICVALSLGLQPAGCLSPTKEVDDSST